MSTKKDFCIVIVAQTIVGIVFPLLPISVMLNFLLLVMRENLFEGETYSFACCAIAISYLQTLVVFCCLPTHIFFIPKRLYFPLSLLLKEAALLHLFFVYRACLSISSCLATLALLKTMSQTTGCLLTSPVSVPRSSTSHLHLLPGKPQELP